jgi:hypothetical protein
MSEAFNTFLAEYNATGRQKLDGYTLVDLDSLTGDERDQATEMLREETIRDGMGIEGLVRINSEVALKTLLQVEQEWPEARTQKFYDLYYWLWKLTGDESYAAKFCSCRPFLRDASINSFYAHASWIIESPTIEKMLREAILVEVNSTGVSTAARALLNKYGYSSDIPATKPEYLAKWRTLTGGTTIQRQQVLQNLA